VCVCLCTTVIILKDFDEIWHIRLESETEEPFRWGQYPISNNLGGPYSEIWGLLRTTRDTTKVRTND